MAPKGEEDRVVIWIQPWRGIDRLFIRAPYGQRQVCASLPGSFWDGSAKAWHIPASPSLWDTVESAFAGLHLFTDDATEALRVDAQRMREALSTKSSSILPAIGVQTKCMNYMGECPTTTGEVAAVLVVDQDDRATCAYCGSTIGSWLHQRRAFHFLKEMRAGAMWIDMGGGKSLVTIALLDYWEAGLVLIQCPKSVQGVWGKQFTTHSLRQWDVFVPPPAASVAKRANAALSFILRPTGRPKALVVNYDAAWRSAMGELLLKMQWDVEVLDESHKIKSPGGKASRYAARMQSTVGRVLLLSGTPDPNNFADIYAQYRAADPGIFGTSFSRFKHKFALERQVGPNPNATKIEGFITTEAEKEFARKLGSISIAVSRDEMELDVPGRGVPVVREVALHGDSYRVYRGLRDELVAEVRGGVVSVDNALVKMMRLRQVTSGYVRTEDGVDSVVGTEKRGLLAEVLDDIPTGEPVVVFAVFHHDLDSIRFVAESRGQTYGELSGRRRDGLWTDGTLAQGVDVLGCQLQSGGVGIDLSRASYGVYYSVDHNRGNIKQSAARLDRPGQRRSVTFIYLTAVTPVGGETVDGVTHKALGRKEAMSEQLFQALKRSEM